MHTGFWWGNAREGRFDSPKYKKIGETKRNLKKNADLGSRLSQVCLPPSLRTDADLGVKETFRTTCS